MANDSSCLVRSQWDFTNVSSSKKWGPIFQVYRPQRISLDVNGNYEKVDVTDRDVITTKSKLRGRGKSLSLLISTEEGKDCVIYGWGLKLNRNDNV